MGTRVVLAAIAAAFIAGAVIGAIIYFRPQGGLGYDRAQLRQLQDAAGFTVLVPTKLPGGYAYSHVEPSPGTMMVFQGPRNDSLALSEAATTATSAAGEPGDPVAVAGTEGRYSEFSGPGPFDQADAGPSRQILWVQDGILYSLTSNPGGTTPSLARPGRDDLVRIANSLKPVDDVLR